MPFPNYNQTILIEEPTYSYVIDLLKLEQVPVKTISRDKAELI